MLQIEFALVLAAVGMALLVPSLGAGWFQQVESQFNRLARRHGLSLVVIALLTWTLRIGLLPVLPVPEPVIHDEFAYLLAADTYAHGRLTNPTHLLWIHFETIGVIQKPSYQCIAQPAQGMILAVGQTLFHDPYWGTCLAAGLMCAAICWMLQGWVPSRWALLGGLLCTLRFGVFGYWANSYWGGLAGAIGGALVIGALPRIKNRQRVRDSLLMGLGLAVLANSRPYEGLVFSLPVAIFLFVWMGSKKSLPLAVFLRRVVIPVSLVLGLTIAGIAYYCWRVTGNPFRMPYQAESQTYGVAPYFIWQKITTPPVFHNAQMQDLYVNRLPQMYRLSRSPLGLVIKLYRSWSFYLWPVLTLPLLALPVALPYGFSWSQIHKRTRDLLLVLVIMLAGVAGETFFEPHYASPLTGVLLALLLLAMRQMSRWRFRGQRSGLFLVRALPVICIIMFALRATAGLTHISLVDSYAPAWHEDGPKHAGRSAIVEELEKKPGQQLAIVRYRADRIPFEEWVYNQSDIDHEKVVWARELSPAQNQELIRYFHDRIAWLIEPDEKPVRVSKYPIQKKP